MDPVKAQDQQYFPTYHLSSEASEVALKEYDLAASTLAAEEKVLNMSTSLLVGFIGIATAFYKDNSAQVQGALDNGLSGSTPVAAFAIVFALITLAATSYFADTRRSVVLASRKIVILRRMLGLSYGQIELVLPNRRVEGANEPYHLPMFHGWFSAKAVPIYCLSVTSAVLVWLFFPRSNLPTAGRTWEWLAPTAGALWGTLVAAYYRLHLLDQYETFWRLIAVVIAKAVRQPLIQDFEYTIYRARLAVIEARRLRAPLDLFRPMLLELEDRQFYSHRGVSPRAIAAAAFRYIRRGKRSGGSTITQQVARTLFIKRMTGSIRRKLVEILLAIWFDKQFPKRDLADLYVCAVRYERGVMGVAEAVKHFFPEHRLAELTTSEAFFLLERVANVRSRLMVDKVAENIQHLVSKGLLGPAEVQAIVNIFRMQIMAGRVLASSDELAALEAKVTTKKDRSPPQAENALCGASG